MVLPNSTIQDVWKNAVYNNEKVIHNEKCAQKLITSLSMHDIKRHVPKIEENKTYVVVLPNHDNHQFAGYETPSSVDRGRKNLPTGEVILPGQDHDVEEIWFDGKHVKLKVSGVGWVIKGAKMTGDW